MKLIIDFSECEPGDVAHMKDQIRADTGFYEAFYNLKVTEEE